MPILKEQLSSVQCSLTSFLCVLSSYKVSRFRGLCLLFPTTISNFLECLIRLRHLYRFAGQIRNWSLKMQLEWVYVWVYLIIDACVQRTSLNLGSCYWAIASPSSSFIASKTAHSSCWLASFDTSHSIILFYLSFTSLKREQRRPNNSYSYLPTSGSTSNICSQMYSWGPKL